jgi:hypothetical protein
LATARLVHSAAKRSASACALRLGLLHTLGLAADAAAWHFARSSSARSLSVGLARQASRASASSLGAIILGTTDIGLLAAPGLATLRIGLGALLLRGLARLQLGLRAFHGEGLLGQDARLLGGLRILGLAARTRHHLVLVGLAPVRRVAPGLGRLRLGAAGLVGLFLVGLQRLRGAAGCRLFPGLVGLQLRLALARVLGLARILALGGFRTLRLARELVGNRMCAVVSLHRRGLRACQSARQQRQARHRPRGHFHLPDVIHCGKCRAPLRPAWGVVCEASPRLRGAMSRQFAAESGSEAEHLLNDA